MSGESPYALNERDLEETFSHSSGPGGQNVNKVATRVTLRHRPSGLFVIVQDTRSQADNRQLARERLAALLAGRRGVTLMRNRSSSRRFTRLSIQPKHSASRTMSSYGIDVTPVCALWRTSQTPPLEP